MGRRTSYRKSMCKVVENLASKAHTDKEIYNALGIGHDSFYTYKEKYSEFSEAYNEGRRKSIRLVVEALEKRALGFEYEEVTMEKRVDAKGKEKPVLIKKTKKYVAPDVKAQEFYLKNRDPENWKDRREQRNVDGEGNDIKPIQVVLKFKDPSEIPDAFNEADFE